MKRCIINVAINKPYTDYQRRLINSLSQYDIPFMTWTDELPKGSRSHSESMYGFKMYAFQEAFNAGYDSVLWLDTPTVLHEDIGFIFDILEKQGELVVATEAKLYRYINDTTLKHYGLDRNEIKESNWMLNFGFVFGFTKGSATYERMFDGERAGLFSTAEEDHHDHITNSGVMFNGEYVEHRHEESIISTIVQIEGRKLLPYSLFAKCMSYEKTPL